MKVFGLIQARMGSSRLPGKVMKPLAGRPLIDHIADRLMATEGVDGVVLSTTQDSRNDVMADYAASRGIPVHRGEGEDDIAGRLAGAARLVGADAVLKVNGDCPLVDPGVMGAMVARFRSDPGMDYISNKIRWTFPEGLSAEVIASRALDWCDVNLTDMADREFVANWIRDHGGRFNVASHEGEQDLSRYKWSVDTPADMDFVASLFDALYQENPLFSLNEVMDFLARNSRLNDGLL